MSKVGNQYIEEEENGERFEDDGYPDTDPKPTKLNSEFLIEKIKEGRAKSGISLKKIWQKIYEVGSNG